ncbi:uncharacterized protein LOC120431094 [Culex pipiens pallens]|uniref:(northern house mosquito) hypothetical protein n=1 Tax=Culex pipiens TaxID=7175 RepID=A0A8D8CJA0_CULPI|nr:uncharacterized protein LOC120431094 [Culex pipiens pallens]
MSTENNNAEVAATAAVSIKLPDFWKNDPVMWFAQAEAQFALGRVVNDETKYYHIIGKVDQTVICHISDLVVAPPADNKYAAVKERLISRFVLSAETRLERLLGSYELGDLRPTHLLAKMRELAIGLKVDDNLLKMLFIQRLPVNVRPILSCHDGTLDKLAEMADKMVGVTSSLTTAAVDDAAGPSGASGLQEQVDFLTAEVRRLTTSERTRNRSASRGRSSSKSRTGSQKEVCWYHRKYGRDAHQCREPCAFNSKN